MSSAAKHVSNKKHTNDFELPADWKSEKRLRSNGRSYDMYYFEPVTKKQFRSLKAVMKHVMKSEEEATAPKKLKIKFDSSSQKPKAANHEEEMQIVGGSKSTPEFKLPEDWIVEETPRENSSDADKYHREPSTGKQFDSLAAVEEYLSEAKDGAAQLKPRKSRSKGKKVVGEHNETSVLDLPVDEVNYVLRNSGGTEWDVYVNRSKHLSQSLPGRRGLRE